ncbi:unnamed protein product [marine sediment metagenome]|uniref:Uncharacterized protein n=1 Tax=marine sediment metagenome TaxID=412755 RepID=X1AC75_9ZZZZ
MIIAKDMIGRLELPESTMKNLMKTAKMEIFKSNQACRDCFFFEYLEISRTLSLVDGHCKLLELIHNTRVVFCSGLDVCKEERDRHTHEKKLSEEQKKAFNKLYERRLDYLRELDVELDRPNDDPDNETREIVIELKKLGTTTKKHIDHLKLRDKVEP